MTKCPIAPEEAAATMQDSMSAEKHPYAGAISPYLTRRQVAERYPISEHTLAKLASKGRGPRFYKPTDKALYLPEDVEAWIRAAVVEPMEEPTVRVTVRPAAAPPPRPRPAKGRGRAKPQPRGDSAPAPSGRRLKSLPPTANSWLRRKD